jgi:hypothetical protein
LDRREAEMSGFQEPENKPVRYNQPSYKVTLWVLILEIVAAFGMMIWASMEKW